MPLIKVVKIKKIIDALLEFIQEDYNNNQFNETFLYKVLGDNIEGNYNFFEQAKAIFLRTDESPRKIQTSLMFNKNTNGTPHVHIRETVRTKGVFNSIGGMTGELNEYHNDLVGEEYRDTRRGSYEILITSINPLETILISEVIYTLLYSAYETLSNEFSLFDFSLKELIFQDQLASTLYAKSISIDTQQENTIPSIIKNDKINDITFFLTNFNV